MQIDLKFGSHKIFFNLIFVNFAIALNFAIIGVGINVLLIIFSFIILIFNIKSLLSLYKDQFFLYLIPVLLLVPLAINPSTFRFTSFFYGLMFISIFQIFIYILHKKNITLTDYKEILLLIIRLYFYVALLQFILFPLGINFNMIWFTKPEDVRINSLATEPSYAGIIIIISFYSYLLFRKKENNGNYFLINVKQDLKYWFFTLFTIAVTQSGYALVFLIILFLSFLSLKHTFLSIISLITIILGANFIEIKSMERVTNLFASLFTLDIYKMVAADHSGSIRVAPIVIFLTQFDLLDIYSWIGHGLEYAKYLMASIIPGIIVDEWKGGGFFPSHIYNYGIISTLAFLYFLKKNAIIHLLSFETLFIFLTFLNSSFNTQLFWYTIIIFTSNKFFLKEYDSELNVKKENIKKLPSLNI